MASLSDYLAFTVIVETKSLTDAAKQLHRSVSAVSKQLSKLESSLGVCLVDRSTKSLFVTELGERFYLKCKKILDAVEEAEQNIKDERISISGKLTLSFPEVLRRSPLMKLLHSFNLKYPEITYDLQVSNQIDNIIDRGIDFAFRMGKLNDSRLSAVSLCQTRSMVCAAPAYIKNYGQPLSINSLFSEHKLFLPTYLNLSQQVKYLFPQLSISHIPLEHLHTSNSEAVIYDSLILGLGIGIMPDISIADDLKAGRLKVLFSLDDIARQDLSLVYHKREYMPEKMRVFKAFMKENF